jgi:2-methylcitrate dehydratase PrpD
MGQQVEQLAQFVARTRWEDVPEPVQRHAKMTLLDTLGVMLAGAERPEARELCARIGGAADGGATVYTRGWQRQDARTAALLNGIGGRAIELCEGLRLVSGQAAIQILPGVLALSESAQLSGRDLMAALITGYDVAGRFGAAFTPRPLAHQNGQASLLAAAAAGARVCGFDAAGVSLAMRIATTLVLTPSYNNAVAGATALNVAGGMSSFACALVPDLVRAGFTAQENAVEEALGSLVGAGFRTDRLLDEIGARWEITRNYFRIYACCNPINPALDSLQEALRILNPRADDIESIDVVTYRFAAVMCNPDPPNYFASKYSLPHAAATLIVRGSAGYFALDDSSLQDPVIAALRQRVHMSEDPAMTALSLRLRPARVTVTLRDGRRATHACDNFRGDFTRPYEERELREKFRELAGTVLTAEGVAKVEQAVARVEQWSSARELTSLMRLHARA